jgi:hypothetical protein
MIWPSLTQDFKPFLFMANLAIKSNYKYMELLQDKWLVAFCNPKYHNMTFIHGSWSR